MTPLSRRAFTAGALAALLAGCGGPGTDRAARGPGDADKAPPAPPADKGGARRTAKPVGRSVPVRLLIPAIEVDTPVMRLGLAADGTMAVPPIEADDRAGWYEHSPTPGRVGPSVIVGHVTVGSYGDGVFRDLARLRRGDRITARLENGAEAAFAVGEVRAIAKADFPADDVYGDVDRPELRLITCGGRLTDDGYVDNLIVFATMIAANGP
ncbi:class F sortase [Streptomyces sp. NPDC006645]|uniref:class F sortase n=1 Tax=unclassified Streptomyces TaxID=2593676 RepID=UPI0033A0618C